MRQRFQIAEKYPKVDALDPSSVPGAHALLTVHTQHRVRSSLTTSSHRSRALLKVTPKRHRMRGKARKDLFQHNCHKLHSLISLLRVLDWVKTWWKLVMHRAKLLSDPDLPPLQCNKTKTSTEFGRKKAAKGWRAQPCPVRGGCNAGMDLSWEHPTLGLPVIQSSPSHCKRQL